MYMPIDYKDQLNAMRLENETAHHTLLRILESARVVGVLDAWVTRGVDGCNRCWRQKLYVTRLGSSWVLNLLDTETSFEREWAGENPDAARAAAAKAIEAGEFK
jgi:hypothetical protein